jgi:hypothetical protein
MKLYFVFQAVTGVPVRSFVKYVRRLNPKGLSLYQKARTSPINGMYYDNASVGHNKLGTFMTEIGRMAITLGQSKKVHIVRQRIMLRDITSI